jgi:PAS domain S-box-containing protein
LSQDITSSQTTTTLIILAEIGEAISANLPLDTILNRIVSALTRLAPSCDAVSIAIPDAQCETFTIRAAVDGFGNPRGWLGWRCPVRDLPTVQTMLRTADLLYLPDTRQSSLWRKALHPDDMARAFLGVPLVMQDRVVGFLFIDFATVDPITEEGRFAVKAFARFAASAIDNAQQRDQLRRSEERYRLVANLTSNAIYEWLPGSGAVEWSSDIDNLLAYSPGAFPRTEADWLNAIHPDDREQVARAREAAVAHGVRFEAEYRLQRSDGAYCHVMDRAAPLADSSHILGAISNLTDIYSLADALINSEVRYRTIFARSPHAIFIIDGDGRIMDVNPAAETLTGCEYTELAASSIIDLALSAEPEQYQDILRQLRTQGEFSNREMRMRRQNGSTIFVEMWGIALARDVYELVAHDVTERQRAQALAAQRTAELIALGDLTRATAAGGDLIEMLDRALPGAMGVLEMPQGCIYLREGQTSTLRLAASAGFDTERPCPETLPLDAIHRGRSTDLSSLVRIIDRPPGFDEPQISIQAPLYANESVIGLVSFCQPRHRSLLFQDINLMDVVARQLEVGIENIRLLSDLEGLVEERTSALMASETRYRSLIEQVPGIVYTANTVYDGLTFISSGTDALCGLLPQAIMQSQTGLLTLVDHEDLDWVRNQANQAAALGKDFDAQYRLTNVNSGVECWVHHRARPIRTAEGNVFWLGLLTDVTRLKELDSLKNQFVATVSHELRTPLSVIKLRAATLRNYYNRLSDADRLVMVERISHQTDILSALIEDVLRLAQIDGHISERRIEPVNVVDIGSDVVEELRPSAESAGLSFYAIWPTEKCITHADASDIARVWRNLIDNAIKYTHGPGSVRIYAGHAYVDTNGNIQNWTRADPTIPPDCLIVPPALHPGGWVVGIVQDTGKGIPESDQAQIFTRFFRGEAAMTNIPGTGLGLSLVRELVEDYGGRVMLRSRLGQGSTFVFWLPATKTEAESWK